jgi:hypothetical protein
MIQSGRHCLKNLLDSVGEGDLELGRRFGKNRYKSLENSNGERLRRLRPTWGRDDDDDDDDDDGN